MTSHAGAQEGSGARTRGARAARRHALVGEGVGLQQGCCLVEKLRARGVKHSPKGQGVKVKQGRSKGRQEGGQRAWIRARVCACGGCVRARAHPRSLSCVKVTSGRVGGGEARGGSGAAAGGFLCKGGLRQAPPGFFEALYVTRQ